MVTMIAFIVAFILIIMTARKQNKNRMAQMAAHSKSAAELGMQMQSDVQQLRLKTMTTENYTGTTGNIAWELQSREIQDRRGTHGSTWTHTTQWTSQSVRVPKGKFLLLMCTPGHDNSKQQLKRNGFLSSITNSLAEGALDLYVSGYFGSQYASLINIEGATKIDIPELRIFFILTNDELLAKKFLNEITVKYIANWIINKPAFINESKVNRLGVLFAPDSTIVACQTMMSNAEEAKVFSDFGAGVATLMKEAV